MSAPAMAIATALLIMFLVLYIVNYTRANKLDRDLVIATSEIEALQKTVETQAAELNKEPDEQWLFYVESQDINDEMDTIEIQHTANAKEFTLKMHAATSKVTAFTNIPHHRSRPMGTLMQLTHLFNASSSKKLSFNVDEQTNPKLHKELAHINESLGPEPFIDQEPNCTISLTQVVKDVEGFEKAINHVVHTSTVAKMTKISMDGSGSTIMTFELLEGNIRPDSGFYEHVGLTIDDFWSWLIVIVSVVAVVATAGAVLVGAAVTAGVAAAATVAPVVAGLQATAAVAGFMGAVGGVAEKIDDL